MDLKQYINNNNLTSWFFNIKIVPNSKNNYFLWELDNGILKFKIKWVPEKWKVNKELEIFVAKELNISKNSVKIVWWFTSRNKLLKIDF